MKLILIAGIPGTGKSTLAEALARHTHIPVFGLDWLLGSLRPLNVLTCENTATVGYALLETLLRRQFMLGQSAILDSPAHTQELRQKWEGIASEYDAAIVRIETICSDLVVHRTRVEGRKRNIPGWHEITWAHVEKMQASWETWTDERIIVDALDPLDDNVTKILDAIAAIQ